VVDGDPVVVSGSNDKTVRVWDARTGQPRGQPLRGHERFVHSVSLGVMDGDPVVVSGSYDKTVRLWDARTGEQFGFVSAGVTSVCMLPRTRLLVIGTERGLILLELFPPSG
jgi:WD40 repeat protein